MKTKLLFMALLTTAFLNAQSITITSEITALELGSTVTVNFTYDCTDPNGCQTFSGLNSYFDTTEWEYYYDGAGVWVPFGTGSSSVQYTVPATFDYGSGAVPLILTADLPVDSNYQINIILHDNGWTPLIDDFSGEINIVAAGTLSVDSFNEALSKISVYPNPSNNTLQIKGLNTIDVSSIKMTNLLGKQVYSTQSKISNIDISNLNAGIYILSVQSNNASKNIKFVKK